MQEHSLQNKKKIDKTAVPVCERSGSTSISAEQVYIYWV